MTTTVKPLNTSFRLYVYGHEALPIVTVVYFATSNFTIARHKIKLKHKKKQYVRKVKFFFADKREESPGVSRVPS